VDRKKWAYVIKKRKVLRGQYSQGGREGGSKVKYNKYVCKLSKHIH